MPAGKKIAECLQALGYLERQSDVQTKAQWPQNAQDFDENLNGFVAFIEAHHAHRTGESFNKWIEVRVREWVQSNGERWSAKDRAMLLPHAPEYPRDEPFIVYWVQQYISSKWENAINDRKENQMSWSIPGLHSHGSMTIQLKNNDGRGDNMQDIENAQASFNSSENHDLDGWNPYQEEEPDAVSSDSAAALVLDPCATSPPSVSHAVVPYETPDSQASGANEPSQGNSSSAPTTNDFRSRTYPLVTFEAEMYAQTTFLVGPSRLRNGHTNPVYGRIMGLEEAQSADTFCAGVLERIREMGEVVGSKKLIARAEWLAIPFVVENEHDHHFLMQTLKNLGESKAQTCLCIVHVSLEDEV